MYTPDSYFTAVILCFITMICWGSWANTQKLATTNWPFQLFYWDYSIGVVLLSLIFGLTLGSSGMEGRPFWQDLNQGSSSAYLSAFTGGVVFNLANLLIVAAIDIAGLAVAFPIGIGIALILGVFILYYNDPVGNPFLLFTGVLLVALAIMLDALAYRKISGQQQSTSTKGIVLSISGGVLMAFFFQFVAASVSKDFLQLEAGKFSPYSAVFIFSLGILLSSFLWNSIFMYNPVKGSKVAFRDYFSQGNIKLHLLGILGGMIWCLGMSLSLIASSKAGFAISYGLGQGATMVAAAWGVFIWKEFANGPKGTQTLLGFMFASFILGLSIIILARVI